MNAAHRLAVARDSAQQILTRPVRNVLVHSHLRPLLLEEKLLIGRRQVKRWLAKEKYFAALQEFAVGASTGFALFGSHPALAALVVLYQNPRHISNGALLHLTLRGIWSFVAARQ